MSRKRKPPIDKKMAVKIKEQIFRRTPGVVIKPVDETLHEFLIGSFFVTLGKKKFIFRVRNWSETGNWAIAVCPASGKMEGKKQYSHDGILGISERKGNSFFWLYKPELKVRSVPKARRAKARKAAALTFGKLEREIKNISFPTNAKSRLAFFKATFGIVQDVIAADNVAESYKSPNKKISAERKPAKSRRTKPKPRQSEVAFEGGKVVVTHKKFERKPQFAQSVKNDYEENDENMPCQICDFSFLDIYGEEGRGFIEAHHLVPLARGKRETQKGDIALVCANCHRVIHRHLAKKPKNPEAWMLEIEGLKKILRRNRKG